jgi:hypothetical protein
LVVRFLFPFLLLIACSSKTVVVDNGDATTNTTDVGSPTDICAAANARAARCDAAAPKDCAKQVGCYESVIRPEDRAGFLDCYANRDCASNDDVCASNAAMKYLSDPTVSAFVSSCNSKRTSCMPSFADDYCAYSFGLFTDEIRTKISDCITKPCTEIQTCFDTIYKAYGCE